MAEESHENFFNFDPTFGLERAEGENLNKPKSKSTKENNSAEEGGSSGKRRFAVVESKALRERKTPATKNGFRWLRC